MALLQSPHWPFLIDVYFFLGGLAGGAFVIATVATLLDHRRFRDVVRAGYYLSIIALIPCPILLIVDLGVPSRFMNMLLAFNPQSPMSMGAWVLFAFSICAFLAAAMTLLEDLGRARDFSGPRRLVGILGVFFGFFLAAYPGVLIGATARPLWTEGHALGALFLAVGASTGAAAIALILMVLGSRRSPDAMRAVSTMLMLAVLVQLLSVIVFVASVQMSGSAAAAQALGRLTGSLTFWLGAILAGSVLPLVLGVMDLKRRSTGLTALASLLVLVGGFLVKFVIMQAGQV